MKNFDLKKHGILSNFPIKHLLKQIAVNVFLPIESSIYIYIVLNFYNLTKKVFFLYLLDE